MASVRTYYYLTKPGIIRGNLLTVTAGFLLASGRNIDFALLLALLGGMSLIIGSACVFNNYIDRHIDAKMARTKRRALVTGKVTTRQAMTYATLLSVAGFVVLLAWVNPLTAAIGLAAFFAYVVLYGVAKRQSPWGTLVGSFPGAAPPVAGYAAVTGHLDTAALLLFLILVFWQMPHFYAIAIYRFKDYKAAGLPVLPVKHGVRAAKFQILAYVLGYIALVPLLTAYGYTGYLYLVIALAAGLVWLWLGLQGFRLGDDVRWARKMFLFSLAVISLFCLAVAADSLLR